MKRAFQEVASAQLLGAVARRLLLSWRAVAVACHQVRFNLELAPGIIVLPDIGARESSCCMLPPCDPIAPYSLHLTLDLVATPAATRSRGAPSHWKLAQPTAGSGKASQARKRVNSCSLLVQASSVGGQD